MNRLDEALAAVESDSTWIYRGHKIEKVQNTYEDWANMSKEERRAYSPLPPGPGFGYYGEINRIDP